MYLFYVTLLFICVSYGNAEALNKTETGNRITTLVRLKYVFEDCPICADILYPKLNLTGWPTVQNIVKLNLTKKHINELVDSFNDCFYSKCAQKLVSELNDLRNACENECNQGSESGYGSESEEWGSDSYGYK